MADTSIIIRRIDPSVPGSHAEYVAFRHAIIQIARARERTDTAPPEERHDAFIAWVEAISYRESLVRARAIMSDGSPVPDALWSELTEEQYLELDEQLTAGGSPLSVTPSASSSPTGSTAKTPARRGSKSTS